MGFFDKLKAGLTKSRSNVGEGVNTIFSSYDKIDDDFYDELEETLIMADVGIKTTDIILANLKKKVKEQRIKSAHECKKLLMDTIKEQMRVNEADFAFEREKTVLLMMNVPSAEFPTIYTVGKGTYMDEMFGIIGAENAFGDKEGWLSISIEEALAADPDVILMDCNWMPGADEAVKALEGWENVTAVKNGDVYQIDEDLCSRPNHHVAEACAEWAKCVYPDQFNEFNMTLELMAEAA